jgi:hypothetical protein
MGNGWIVVNCRKYATKKINNFTNHLEKPPRALDETARPPEVVIKGVIMLNGCLIQARQGADICRAIYYREIKRDFFMRR